MSDEVTRVISVNRRARYDYEILETAEAGIALTGAEIKSVREGRVNIREAYAQVRDGEMTLLNMHIAPFKGASHYSVEQDTTRPRKLLLHKSEIPTPRTRRRAGTADCHSAANLHSKPPGETGDRVGTRQTPVRPSGDDQAS